MNDELATLSSVIERTLASVTGRPAELRPDAVETLREVRASVARMESLLATALDDQPGNAPNAGRSVRSHEASAATRPGASFQRRSEGVLRALEQMIVSGEVHPGDRLPTERELAERFKVGRNSVREAIRQLALLGLVEAFQGGGTFVTETTTASLVRPFLNVVQFGGATAANLMEFRIVFEPAVAALAAMRRDSAALTELETALCDFEEAIAAGSHLSAEHDTRFHHLVAAATGNPVLAAIESALMEFLRAFRQQALARAAYTPDDRAVHGHRDVFERIVDADPLGAADAMQAHLTASLVHVIAHVDVTPTPIDD